ncbi:ABC transporter substrate-binding protein [Mahella australiensis]|uniref:Carbohydrate ABC transporter substrate-binding protein, CUT1 family n=1 Tax=Mahella australiensis (strain DSM 15567 / CIP 107919 / 50-1 BON) TaxID=697281 RepID=F3ZVM0_MAHA5|nr:extracellular solute-binding protein [Mahella australiensis]AEE96382.1 carbohydrate ABC transporter substrate-binding protein, CUT1 family [Mahella australiensis 50-1 BON]
MNKRLLALVLAAVMLVFVLSACGGSQTSDNGTGDNAAETQPGSEGTDNSASEEAITVTYARGKDTTTANQKMLEAFEAKYPNIKINYQEMPPQSDQQHNAFVTALSAGDDSVDVYRLDIIWPAEFAAAGWVEPLDDYFTEEERAKFLQGPIQGCTYNGSIYAVPLYTDAGVLYYRKDLVSTPPETWDELYNIGKQLMDEGKVDYGFVFQANQYEGLVCNVLEYIHSNGGKVLDGSNVVLNSENSIEALNIFKKMLDIAPEGVTTYIENDGGAMFQEGKAAFMRNWPNWWSNLNKDESAVKDKVGIAPIPKGPKGDATGKATLGGWNLSINKNSKNKDAAWKFIEFMTGEEGQKIQSVEGGYLPTRQSLYKDPDVIKANPHFESMYDVLVNALPRPVSPFYPKISESIQINTHKFLMGEIDAKTAVENMAKEIQDTMAQ